MKTLTTWLAVLTLGTTLGIAGCKKKDASNETPAAKTADQPAAMTGSAAPAMTGSAATAPATATATAAGSATVTETAVPADLPQECKDYLTTMNKLVACDKVPQATRDAMKQGAEAMKTGWTNFASLPADSKAGAVKACKEGMDDLNQTGKEACGW